MTNRFHVPGMVYVSTSSKLVFIPIPKNASTTIRSLVTANFRQIFLKNMIAVNMQIIGFVR